MIIAVCGRSAPSDGLLDLARERKRSLNSVCVAVVGPTATGKSDLALDLAEALSPANGPAAEIVNADAYQLYRGMDIGTAKVPMEERRRIAHHQLDVLDPRDDATVAQYQAAARVDLDAITARGARAIVVGGSGLYVRALLDHIEFPGTDVAVRAALESRAETEGIAALFAELSTADPAAAKSIGPHNGRRIVRALEVIEITGRPYSANLPEPRYVRPAVQIGLDCSREVLDSRVVARVEKMRSAGLVAEVRSLASPAQGGIGPGLGTTASRAVGYKEILELFAAECSEDEAFEAIAIHTRQLARKQMTWFGRDSRVQWLNADAPDLLSQALAVVAAADRGELPQVAAGHTRRPLGS